MNIDKILTLADNMRQNFSTRQTGIDYCRRYGYQMRDDGSPAWEDSKRDSLAPIPDSYQSYCARLLAQYLSANTFGAGNAFFSLTAKNATNNGEIDVYTAAQIRDLSVKVMKRLMDTNLYSTALSAFMDVAVVGNAITFVDYDEKRDTFFFKNFEVGRGTFFSSAPNGEIDMLSRRFALTAKNAVLTYGKENVAKSVYQKSTSAETASEETEYVWLVYPRELLGEIVEQDAFGKTVRGAIKTKKRFASVIIDVQNRVCVSTSGFDDFPFAVLRWQTMGGNDYGYSPTEMSIPDIKYLFRLEGLMKLAIEKQVSPPMLANSLLESISTAPNAISFFEGLSEVQAPIVQLPVPANLPLLDQEIARRKQNIYRNFMLNEFEAINETTKYMTAEEVRSRNNQSIRAIAPIVYRIHNEYLSPIIKRVFVKMIDNKEIELPNGLTIEEVSIKYHSSLDSMVLQGELARMQTFVGNLGAIIQSRSAFGDFWDAHINNESLLRHMLEYDNVPSDVMHKPEQIENNINAIKQAQAEAQQAQIAQSYIRPIDMQKNAEPQSPMSRY